MKEENSPVFQQNTIEFVTVAAQFCAFIEQTETAQKDDFVDTCVKLLPLLYVKTLLLPACNRMDNRSLETFVTEVDYTIIRNRIASFLGEDDDFLEVFVDDMAYSDTPIKQSISEGIADVYQPLKDFLGTFQMGFQPTMHEALAECIELFYDFWGQRTVNLIRALHALKANAYKAQNDEDGNRPFDFYQDDFMTEEDLYEGLDMGEEEQA